MEYNKQLPTRKALDKLITDGQGTISVAVAGILEQPARRLPCRKKLPNGEHVEMNIIKVGFCVSTPFYNLKTKKTSVNHYNCVAYNENSESILNAPVGAAVSFNNARVHFMNYEKITSDGSCVPVKTFEFVVQNNSNLLIDIIE